MPDLLSLTGPIFALIGLGFLAVRSGAFDRALLPALGRFVMFFCLPALLWRALSQRSPADLLDPHTGAYLLAYAAGSLLVFGAGLACARRQGQPLAHAAITAMGMSCSNTAFIGFPLALQVVGPQAALALALGMLVENFLMIPLALALAESAAAPGGAELGADRGRAAAAPSRPGRRLMAAIGRAAWGLRRNPIVLGIVAGVLTAALRAATGLELPGPLLKAIDLLAAASTATSLFYIGGMLVGLGFGKGLQRQVAAVATGKLLLHPAAVALALWVVERAWAPLPAALHTCALLMAAAPMLGIYPILGQRHGREAVNAACLLGATLAAFASLSALLLVLRHTASG